MPEVAIFSTSIDRPTWGPVAEKLTASGYCPWVFEADKVANGSTSFCIETTDGEVGFTYGGTNFSLKDIQSAWFRHPQILGISIDDKAKQLSIEREISSLNEDIWQLVPDSAWLNHPGIMRRSQAKLSQLIIASEVGFATPDTVVSNDWDHINGFFSEKDAVVKMPRGVLFEGDKAKVLYTTILNPEQREGLRFDSPFPAIYQNYLIKLREWRITVVGDDIFEVAIYTDKDAKDDWRRHQFTGGVRFAVEKMPVSESQKCLAYLGRLGLTYGAFDFIEDDDGKITFLECNTNGQFRWLEDLLDLPISDAIVSKLINRVHKKNDT